jgi:uncharacterized protein (DUF1330 family)
MNYFFIAQILITDPEEYQKYLDRVDEVFDLYKGTYLVVETEPVILEGTWNFTKTVIIGFDSEADFNDWYYSKEYQEIMKYRLKGSVSNSILARALRA